MRIGRAEAKGGGIGRWVGRQVCACVVGCTRMKEERCSIELLVWFNVMVERRGIVM